MDEVEAALDESNIFRFTNFIQNTVTTPSLSLLLIVRVLWKQQHVFMESLCLNVAFQRFCHYN